jgi:hypothetical protein
VNPPLAAPVVRDAIAAARAPFARTAGAPAAHHVGTASALLRATS